MSKTGRVLKLYLSAICYYLLLSSKTTITLFHSAWRFKFRVSLTDVQENGSACGIKEFIKSLAQYTIERKNHIPHSNWPRGDVNFTWYAAHHIILPLMLKASARIITRTFLCALKSLDTQLPFLCDSIIQYHPPTTTTKSINSKWKEQGTIENMKPKIFLRK